MFSDNSSFELYNSVIVDCRAVEDTITLKCLYMEMEFAYITFEKVSGYENYDHLQGNTISFIKEIDGGFEINYLNETIAPTIIRAESRRIEWN